MTQRFDDLDALTRLLALDELWQDGLGGRLYLSSRLTPVGVQDWPILMQMALLDGDPRALADALRQGGRMRTTDDLGRRLPRNAARMLAQGEFNRYYCRGVCRRALTQGLREVEVFRARAVANPRPSSQEIIGMLIDASWLLDDLRRQPQHSVGRVPGGPNSGLSVRLPRPQARCAA